MKKICTTCWESIVFVFSIELSQRHTVSPPYSRNLKILIWFVLQDVWTIIVFRESCPQWHKLENAHKKMGSYRRKFSKLQHLLATQFWKIYNTLSPCYVVKNSKIFLIICNTLNTFWRRETRWCTCQCKYNAPVQLRRREEIKEKPLSQLLMSTGKWAVMSFGEY